MFSKQNWIKTSLILFLLVAIGGIVKLYFVNQSKRFMSPRSTTLQNYRLYSGTLQQLKEPELLQELDDKTYTMYAGGPLPSTEDMKTLLTFHSDFIWSPTGDNEPLYLFIPTAEYPLEIYVNNHLIYQCGDMFSPKPSSKFFGEKVPILPIYLHDGINDFTVQVAQQKIRTELPHFELGAFREISTKSMWYTVMHYGTHFAFTILSGVLFIFMLSIWIIRPKEKSILMFAFTALFIGTAYLNMLFNSTASDSLLLWQISRFSYVAAAVMIFLFSLHNTFVKISWKTFAISCLITAAISYYFCTLQTKSDILNTFALFSRLVIAPVMLSVPILFLTHYIKTKELSSFILFVSSLINSLTSMHDLLFNVIEADPYIWLLPYGFCTLQLGISLIFIIGLRNTYKELRTKKEEAERSQAELITARDQAKSANEAKSVFLAKMSHEIRTPINGIIGMNTLMRDTSLNERQSGYVEIIHQSSNDLLEIINDILDFSKIEAGKMDIEERPFNLRENIDELVKMMQFKTEDKTLTLTSSLDPAIEHFYIGAQGRIRQVFNNLLHNAFKFTEEGTISITGKLEKTDAQKHIIRFEISDTGIGLSHENQERIFKSFTQADSSTTRKYGGTGLGLSICKEFCTLMGGEIGVESQVGVGSNFWFTLPLKPATSAHPIPADTETIKLSQIKKRKPNRAPEDIKILLAEDNVVNQKVAHGLLSKFGYTTHIANNGVEVLDAMDREEYDLILMDCHMPELDGYEAATKIREMGSPIPIVALTANAMIGDREKCLESGMNNYIVKPLRAEILSDVIARYTQNS